jgi:tripartite-type tricarboxylate transporter receptor subunit TctC
MKEILVRIRIKTLALAALATLGALPTLTAAQESWPNRPISLIVPFPPGGTTDIIGRQIALRLREELGQAVVVENRAGAATAIGAAYVARAPKDGYTLLLSSGTTFTVNPHLNAKLQYRLDDFEPVSLVTSAPFAFVVRNDFPAKTVKEFVEYAKANPNKINNATNGQGSMVHLLGEMIATGLNVKMTQIHYKGAAPAMADIMGGVVDSNVEALTNAVPNVVAGKYRALAVLSSERQALLPDVPTFRELGYPDIVGETWFAVFAPAGTPKSIITTANAALSKITSSPAFVESMRKIGNEAKSGSPADLLATTQEQSKVWGGLIKRLNISLQ